MTDIERLEMLRELRSKNSLNCFKTHEEFVEWQGKVAPLLNFNQFYYNNFVRLSSTASIPKLSSYTYRPLFSQMQNLIIQAITELEYELTPPSPTQSSQTQTTNLLSSDHNLLWYCCSASLHTRRELILFVLAIFSIGFLCGRNTFLRELYNLIKINF